MDESYDNIEEVLPDNLTESIALLQDWRESYGQRSHRCIERLEQHIFAMQQVTPAPLHTNP